MFYVDRQARRETGKRHGQGRRKRAQLNSREKENSRETRSQRLRWGETVAVLAVINPSIWRRYWWTLPYSHHVPSPPCEYVQVHAMASEIGAVRSRGVEKKYESGGTARCIPLAKMHPPQAQGSPLLSEQGVHGGTVFLGKGISMIRRMYAAAAAAPWAWALAPTQKSLKTVKTEERCTIRYPTQRSTRQTSQESMVASSSVCLLVLASRGLWSVSLQSRDCGLLAAPGANQGTEADTDTGTGTGTDAGKTPTDGYKRLEQDRSAGSRQPPSRLDLRSVSPESGTVMLGKKTETGGS